MPWGHPKLQDVVAITTHLVMPLRTGTCVVHNIGTSQASILPGPIEAFDPPVSMSYCLQTLYRIAGVWSNLPTHGLRRNTSIPVPPVLSLKNSFQRKSPEILGSKCSPSLWHIMCHRIAHLGHKTQGKVESWHRVSLEAFSIFLVLMSFWRIVIWCRGASV